MMGNVLEFSRNMKIPIEQFSIRVEGTRESKPERIGEIRAILDISGEIPPERIETIKRVAKGCRIHNTLSRSPKIEVDLQVSKARA